MVSRQKVTSGLLTFLKDQGLLEDGVEEKARGGEGPGDEEGGSRP